MNKLLTYLVGTVVLSTLTACAPAPTTGNTAAEIFEHLIQSPVPAAVSDLQATGDTWQGYSLWMRFTATNDYIAELTTKGFTNVPCPTVQGSFTLPKNYDRFNPRWKPVFDTCYEGDIPNTWGNGHHTIGIDTQTNTVYFYGIAA
jgi:hypothetical protein